MSTSKNIAGGDRSSLSTTLKAMLTKHEKLIKYFVIGGSASALDVILFLVIHNVLGASPLVAQSISVPTSVIYSFVINARHNFRTNDYMWLRLFSFSVVAFVGYLLGLFIIEASIRFGLDANIGKLVSLPFVFVTQFVLNSKITFMKVKPS